MTSHARAIAAGTCLFLSGAASLVYEIAWVREAALVFGSGTHAVATVVGVFFAGLAIGSEFAGRRAGRLRSPARVFALAEIALALWALASIPGFPLAERALVGAHAVLGGAPAALALARVGLVAAIVLVPAALMGVSLPLLCGALVRSDARLGAQVGRLYAVNTLGAVVGCLGAGFVLLPRVGMTASVSIAAALDVVAAGLALGVARTVITARGHGDEIDVAIDATSDDATRTRRSRAAAEPRVAPHAADPSAARRLRAVTVLYALVGFVALGHEVVWTRVLALVSRNSAHVWSLTLGTVLVGLVLGSLLASAVVDRGRRRAEVFGALQIAAALLAWLALLLPAELWRALGPRGVLLLLPTATLSGASFPIAVRLAVDEAARASLGAGRLVAANAVGGVVGSLVVGFLALPALGLQTTLLALTGLGLAVGAIAWERLAPPEGRGPRRLALAAAAALWLAFPARLGTRLPEGHLVDDGERLIAHVEGRTGELTVIRRAGVTSLEIDRWWQGEDTVNHQSVAAVVPRLLHPDPRAVLVVGVGTGQTPSRLLSLGVAALDAVDVEPAVFDVVRAHFDGAWLDDPRVRVIADDGRHHLLHARAAYDLVSLELGQVFAPPVAACYTREFYDRVRDALRPRGIACQFVPTAFLDETAFARVVATFRAAFPESVLWYNTSELLLIGARDGELPLPPERLARLEHDGAVRAALDHAHWGGDDRRLLHMPVFLAGFLAGPDELAAIAGDARPLRDDRPWLEFAAARVDAGATLEIPLAATLAAHLGDVGTALSVELAPDVRTEIDEVRALNLGEMVASARLRGTAALERVGDSAALVALADAALAHNPEHPHALSLRGRAAFALGDLDAARRDLERAVAYRPDDAPSLVALAFTLHRAGDLGAALDLYERALARVPDEPELHNNVGSLLAQLGRVAEAREHFAAAVALRPEWTAARENLAQADALLGERSR